MALSVLTTLVNFVKDNILLIRAVGGVQSYGYDKWRNQKKRIQHPEFWKKYSHLSIPSVYHNAVAVNRS
jgi:hypothetical protein